jgi:hypothetical protein
LLVYESTEQLLAEPEPRRYLHTVILTALRDKAEYAEIRFGDGDAVLYYRVDGRDWELFPTPEAVYPVLKETIRSVARLVRPERPEVTVMAAPPGAKFEPLEVGWLTYRLGPDWIDLVVRIDPREPFGFVRFEFDGAEDFADAAGEALAGYAAVVETRDLDAAADASESP